MEKKKLNIGCGNDIKEEYVNLDYFSGKGIDVVHDLEKFPYPFDNDQFEEILMDNVLEHLFNTEKVMEELVRISQDGATIKIMTPHCKSSVAWGDITHKTAFSADSFKHYEGSAYAESGSKENERFFLNRKEVRIYLPVIFKLLGFEKYINHNDFRRYLYERYFSGIVIPVSLFFKLEVKK
ncbi:MAG: hypothetical protein ABEJ02_03945 [Candidatus Paceibacteria bacterium]